MACKRKYEYLQNNDVIWHHRWSFSMGKYFKRLFTKIMVLRMVTSLWCPERDYSAINDLGLKLNRMPYLESYGGNAQPLIITEIVTEIITIRETHCLK